MDDFIEYTTKYARRYPDRVKRVKQSHLTRAKKGVDHWNLWAASFEAFIKKNSSESFSICFHGLSIKDVNFRRFDFPCRVDFCDAILESADFGSARFNSICDFEGAVFNGISSFHNTHFGESANFEKAKFFEPANFEKARFCSDGYFSEVKFHGSAQFNNAIFDRFADFSEVSFGSLTEFKEVEFKGPAMFIGSTFLGIARFSNTEFSKRTEFLSVIFNHEVDLSNSQFYGTTIFDSSEFKSYINFSGVEFKRSITFDATKFQDKVPDFNFVSFLQPPFISNIILPENMLIAFKHNQVEVFRKLKQLSIQSRDHENELRFFGYEMRAKAYHSETPTSQKIFIQLYYLFSNFGSSLIRPMVWLLLIVAYIFIVNLFVIQADSEDCIHSQSKFEDQVILYTLSEAIPLVRLKSSQRLVMEECLFGSKPFTLMHNLWAIAHIIPTGDFQGSCSIFLRS